MTTGPIRQPAVAGRFYPSRGPELAAAVREYLSRRQVDRVPCVAVIAPHAGYVYSGSVAGAAYARVEPAARVVILGVNHWSTGAAVASWSTGRWRTPLGDVAIDDELCAAIGRRMPQLVHDEAAHGREHSLEVQVPFLQVLAGDRPLSIAPIALATHDAEILAELGHAIADALRTVGERVLIVASTDMSHYISATAAREKDELALARVRALDGPGLLATVLDEEISMCGVAPTTSALIAARELGAGSAELALYANSGDVTGDHDSVVGYAGLVVH